MGYTQPQPALQATSGTWWAMVFRGQRQANGGRVG